MHGAALRDGNAPLVSPQNPEGANPRVFPPESNGGPHPGVKVACWSLVQDNSSQHIPLRPRKATKFRHLFTRLGKYFQVK
jgi:hypothetical protein